MIGYFIKYYLILVGSSSVIRPILIGDLLGRDNVNNAYGWNSLFFGIANLFGVPLAGA